MDTKQPIATYARPLNLNIAAASERTGVLVAPPLNFGVSPYFARYPGTISLRVSTFQAVLEDLARSVPAQGFRRLLCMVDSAVGHRHRRGRQYRRKAALRLSRYGSCAFDEMG
jgi:hypothetical protein